VETNPGIAASLDLQEKCANQARKVLVQLRQDGRAQNSPQNHYSEQLNKCFIWTRQYSATDKFISWEEDLIDAFEGTPYALFLFHNDLTKKLPKPPAPVGCYADLPQGTEYCKDFDGFVKLIGVYLNMP
jgi:hypothetical protein